MKSMILTIYLIGIPVSFVLLLAVERLVYREPITADTLIWSALFSMIWFAYYPTLAVAKIADEIDLRRSGYK